MSLTSTCCTLPPVQSNYVPKGTETTQGDLTVYEVGDKNCQIVLIGGYDIFGFHPTTKQFCDKLTESNKFRVIMPDFFRGKPLSMENFPPERSQIMNFIATTGAWEKYVKNDMPQLLEHYKKEGAKIFGIFGFCWGAKFAFESSVALSNDVKASVLIHPSIVETNDADRATNPVLLLPTKDDADFIPFYEKLKTKFAEDQCGHHRFEDMPHGFAAARGNMEDELNRKRVDEALKLTHHFFKKNLKK